MRRGARDDDANPHVLVYPTGDNHPSSAGNQKATVEFVPLPNRVYADMHAVPECSFLGCILGLMTASFVAVTLTKRTRFA